MKHDSASIYKNEFVSAVKSRLGISIQNNQVDGLLKTIVEACDKFDCEPIDFLEMIKSGPSSSAELDYLSTNITIGETYFFRDKRQMKIIEEYVLPNVIADKRLNNNLSIRIWSAGCSSGEEIYTVAMQLKELLPDIDQWTIFLLGTDINTNQLHKAVKGVYSEWSMRSINPYYKNKYFKFDGIHYHLVDSVKSMVEFSYLNLNDENYPSIINNTNAHDLIICRNVLIYFDDDSITRLMSKMSLCLAKSGYFLLGASDPINVNINKLVRHHEYTTLLVNQPIAVPKPVPEEAQKQSIIIQPDSDIALPAVKVEPRKHDKILINKKVVDPVGLANEGKLQEAVKEFISCIKEDKTNKRLYLDFAMTLIELNRLSEAEEALKKAIFLDNKFVMAHFQLGILKMRANQKEEGIRHLKNALRIAKNEQVDNEVQGNPGMTYGKLAEILEKELLIFYD